MTQIEVLRMTKQKPKLFFSRTTSRRHLEFEGRKGLVLKYTETTKPKFYFLRTTSGQCGGRRKWDFGLRKILRLGFASAQDDEKSLGWQNKPKLFFSRTILRRKLLRMTKKKGLFKK
ncbi:MAG: hypothetical protein R3B41_01095 [Candidatus Doudnabacteria bacterium]